MSTQLTKSSAARLCHRLLEAESEPEVITALSNAGLWDDRDAWIPYGGIKNNRGIVGNQQSEPVAALVEKLVNSIDSVLIYECLKSEKDPRGAEAPQSMKEAVKLLLGVPEGRIETLGAGGRSALAERIQFIATGKKRSPNYLIIDSGEGQTPDSFPNTFLSLLGENKAGIPFVQGTYNMGGTGVLQFSGRHSFQLIISRRQPEIADTPEDSRFWGFTLVRRVDPGPHQSFTTYAYLAPGGEVPRFEEEAIAAIPGRYPDAYVDPLPAGTIVKVWDYKLPGGLRTLATLDIRYALEQQLQDPALPIRIRERRHGYKAHTYDTTMSGLFSVLADAPDVIEEGLDTGGQLDVPSVGGVEVRIVALKEDRPPRRYPTGVYFTVNGQTHAHRGKDFISRKTQLDYIAGSLIVIVDCTELPQRVREDVFHGSRDRMRNCIETNELLSELASYLHDHPGLRELNARRRQQLMEKASEEQSTEVMQRLVNSDPSLAALFGRKKGPLKVIGGQVPEPVPYEGKPFPTHFRIAREPGGGLVKHCPRNRRCHVAFETDASNDYFTRAKDKGELSVAGQATLTSRNLWNGKAALRFSLPEGCFPGDQFRVIVEVSDISRVEAMRSEFTIQVDEDAPPNDQPRKNKKPKQSLRIPAPNIIEVRRDQWHSEQFDEFSALKLAHGEDGTLDMLVNMDNLFLRNEIHRRRGNEASRLQHWYKYGLALLALGMLYRQESGTPEEQDQRNESSSNDASSFDDIEESCKGIAVTLIPLLALASSNKLGP